MVTKIKSALEELSENLLFQKIGDICSAANTVTTPEELLELSLKSILELFNAKRGSIFILDESEETLILKSSQGMKPSEKDKMVKRMGEGIVGQVAQFKKPIVVEDIAKDTRFDDYKSHKGYLTPSFICAPLMIKDELIGVINITDKESGHRFNKNEVQLLDFLSSQIALNYRRIQLYHNFKKIVKETETLKDQLGKSDEQTEHLKKKIVIQEKLATIGKLAGGIAHEFNNPLDGVMRYTNLCLSHIKDDEVVRGYLLEIKHGLDRMACGHNTHCRVLLRRFINNLSDAEFFKHPRDQTQGIEDLRAVRLWLRRDIRAVRWSHNLLRYGGDCIDTQKLLNYT